MTMGLIRKGKAPSSREKGSSVSCTDIGKGTVVKVGYVTLIFTPFFDSIPHDVALREIKKRAPDPFALAYCEMAMESHRGEVGVGLGSELSQLTGLTVLDGVDHVAKEKCKAKCYVRYMDDSVAVFKTKEEAKAYLKVILKELTERGLTASPKKTLIFPLSQGVTFLGWRYILRANGRIVCKPRKGKVAKLKRKLRRMKKAGVPVDTMKESLNSFISSLLWGDAKKEIKSLQKFFKEEISQ
jgi:RNA-directed DNA polymerase